MNRSQLISAALAYADRKDASIPGLITNTFFLIVEARLNRSFRTRRQSGRAKIATRKDTNSYALPSDFAGMRDIRLYDPEGNIISSFTEVTPEYMNVVIHQAAESMHYCVQDCAIVISPSTENYYIELLYYQKVTPLVKSTDTNWIATDYPDAYIHGLMVEISAFTKDAEATILWEQRFEKTLASISSEDAIDRWSGTPLAMKLL